MNTTKPTFSLVLTTSLIFAAISIGVNVVKYLINTHFGFGHLLTVSYIVPEVLLEFLLQFAVAVPSYFLARNFLDGKLGGSLLSALIFSSVYATVGFLLTAIALAFAGGSFSRFFDWYDSFIRLIPNAFSAGLIFVIVWRSVLGK